MNKIKLIITLVFLFSLETSATTWGPAKHTCPVCQQTETYYEIMSYGSYIYQWSSKYQYVYWPLTDPHSVYCCPHCHFSVFMSDFDSIPKEKKEPISLYLKSVTIGDTYENYVLMPMTLRLQIAEKMYDILGGSPEFWCRFYRVLGYHYDLENNKVYASDSRQKAIDFARVMVYDTAYKGQKKENLLIMSAMYTFLGNKDSSLIFLNQASSLTYTNNKMKDENAKGLDNYLSDLILQYKDVLNMKKRKFIKTITR